MPILVFFLYYLYHQFFLILIDRFSFTEFSLILTIRFPEFCLILTIRFAEFCLILTIRFASFSLILAIRFANFSLILLVVRLRAWVSRAVVVGLSVRGRQAASMVRAASQAAGPLSVWGSCIASFGNSYFGLESPSNALKNTHV